MKYPIKNYIACIIVLYCFSCNNSNKTGYDEKSVGTVVLHGNDMKCKEDIFVSNIIALDDSILYLKSMMKDTLINVYNVGEDSLILFEKFLKNGVGPNEIINVFSSTYDRKTKRLSFFENSGKLTKGYVLSKEEIGIPSLWQKLDFSQVSNCKFGHSFVYISDSLLLGIGSFYNMSSILSIINLKGKKTVIPLQFWPKDGFEKNALVKQSVYMDNAKIYMNGSQEKYLYVCGSGKYMEIFKINNNQIMDRVLVCESYPKYEVKQDNINYSPNRDDINQGFSVFTTDSLIYAKPEEYTLDQLSRGNYKGYLPYYNDRILVFDWNGKLIKKYELDVPFNTFVVDEQNKLIYVDTDDLEDGRSIIKKYNLN